MQKNCKMCQPLLYLFLLSSASGATENSPMNCFGISSDCSPIAVLFTKLHVHISNHATLLIGQKLDTYTYVLYIQKKTIEQYA